MSTKAKSRKKRGAKAPAKKGGAKRHAKRTQKVKAKPQAKPRARAKAHAKAKARTKPKVKPRAKAKATEIRRRDRAGHLDPQYAADLRSRSEASAEPADSPGFLRRPNRSNDDVAEQLGEEVIDEATSGESVGEDVLNQEVSEESGGPFVVTSGDTEFALEPDDSNPKGSSREPFPRT
jgi:hypothetical protein